MTTLRWLGPVMVLGALACNGGPPAPAPIDCARDASLLARSITCLEDLDCPCGAHCALGTCAHECTSDADCGEGACSALGRCGRAGQDDYAFGGSFATEGDLSVDLPVVRVGPGEVRTVRLFADGAPIELARVVGGRGIEVRCDGVSFASECTLDPIDAGAEALVEVRASTPLSPTDAVQVDVFWARAHTSFSVAAPEVTTLGTGTVRGTYEGVATRASGADDLHAIPVRVQIALDATGTSGTLRIEDPTQALHPGGAWSGALAAARSSWRVELPAFDAFSVAAPGESEYRVRVLGADVPMSIEAASHSIALTIPIVYEGTHGSATSPIETTWTISASRVALETDALTSDTATAPVAPPSPAVPFAWEAAIDLALADAVEPSTVEARYRGRQGGSDELGVETCTREPDAAEAITSSLLARGPTSPTTVAALRTDLGTGPVALAIGSGLFADGRGADVVGALSIVPDEITLPDGALPCAFGITSEDGGAATLPVRGAPLSCLPTTATLVGTAEMCGSIAEAYDCVAETLATPIRVGATILADVHPIGCAAATPSSSRLTVVIGRVCRPRAASRACAEMALCAEPDFPLVGSSRLLGEISGGDTSASGDLACGRGLRAAALDLELASDRGEDRNQGDVAEACLAELRAGAMGPSVGATFGDAECIDVARFLYALGHATEPARAETSDPHADRLAARLVQQWLSVHAFVARQSATQAGMREVLAGGGATAEQRVARTIVALDEALATSVAGWDLVVHPRVGAALATSSSEVLRSPDYRVGVTIPATVVSEQGTGLPVVMIEALIAQLELADRLLESTQLVGSRDLPTSVAALFARVPAIQALADGMATRARIGGEPEWGERYEAALASLRAHLTSSTDRAHALVVGSNPLGIDEDDVPFVFGDAPTITMPAARFSAVPRYILDGPVASSVASARAAFTRAEASYAAYLQRRYQERVGAADAEARAAEAIDEAASALVAFCGAPPGVEGAALFSDASWGGAFAADECALRREVEGCVASAADAWRGVTDDDVRYQVCLRQEIATRGPQTPRSLDVEPLASDPWWALVRPDAMRACTARALVVERVETSVVGVSCGGRTAPIESIPGVRPGLTGPSMTAIVDAARTACQQAFPSARAVPRPVGESDPVLRAGCWRGSLGEQTLAVRSSLLALRSSAAAYDTFAQSYQSALESCRIQNEADARFEVLETSIRSWEEDARRARLGADILSATADSVAACAQGGGDALKEIMTGGTATAAVCITQGIALVANIAALGIEFDAANEVASLEGEIGRLERASARAICLNDARGALIGQAGAMIDLRRAGQDLQSAMLSLQNQRSDAQAAYEAGRAILRAGPDRPVAAPALDGWLDADITDFQRDMRRARRSTYLAVRATEHELQQTLPDERAAALLAQVPGDLEEVAAGLDTLLSTPGIGGRRPESFKTVVSLATNVLAIQDLASGSLEGWPTASRASSFANLLASARASAIARGDGMLRIPFSLAPHRRGTSLGTDEIAVFTTDTCAEQLWSVNAIIVGAAGADAYRGDATFVPLVIAQANRFSSQRCDATADVSDQLASYTAGELLFREPGVDAPSSLIEPDLATPAAIDAALDVPRSEFERDEYANGASSQLAARGLYGRYFLEIPLEHVADPDDPSSTGLDLSQVQDVLLRFDYVAVSR